MNDNEKIGAGFALECVFHYVLVVFVFALIGVSGLFVYEAISKPPNQADNLIYSNESEGEAHPLPDFIVDTVPRDELESLKP